MFLNSKLILSKTFSTASVLNSCKCIPKVPSTKMERITRKDHDDVMEFIRDNYFKDEPLIRSLHLVGCRIEPQLHKFVESMVTQGMSIKCVDIYTGKNIIGVSINRRLTPEDTRKLHENSQKCVSPFSRRLMDTWILMNTAPSLFKEYNDEEIFDIWLGAVRNDMRNRGLGKQLVQASMCLARELNYETASMDCTNKYSSIIARQLGMRLHWEHPFRLITGSNISCAFPHTHVQVYGKRLAADNDDTYCNNVKFIKPDDFDKKCKK